MTLRREEFLAGSLAAGAVTAARRPRAPARIRSWGDVRAQFALAPGYVQLSSFLLASHPRPVRQAIERHRRGLDANARSYLHENEARLEDDVRDAAARYLETGPEQIALTDSTTMGIGLLYGGIGLRPGEEVLTTVHDFYATHEALRLRAARSGVRVRKIRLYDRLATASADEIVDAIRKAVTPRTRVVAVTWVHSSTGLKLPIRRIADALGRRALLCVDGVHGLGVERESVAELGCDFLVSGCHKWLFGPRGTGIIWGRPSAWAVARATIPTFDARSYGAWLEGRPPVRLPPAAAMTPGGYHSFEHRWALAEAFRFQLGLGKGRVHARTHTLARRLKEGLRRMRNVTLQTPLSSSLSAGLVCFEVAGVPAAEVVSRLERRRVLATVTPYATEYVRLGPSIVNSEDDVDRALREIRAIAR